MSRYAVALTALGLGLFALLGVAGSVPGQPVAPPGGAYRKASELVGLPDFVPGLGTLYVDPARLPEGPYLAYDRAGHLVSTVFMMPLQAIEAHTRFALLAPPVDLAVDHVDIVYGPAHPGMPEPHYHIILWYIPKAQARLLQ